MAEVAPPGYEAYLARVRSGLDVTRERIGLAAARAGRDPSAIEIVAVSKFHPTEAVGAALACGIRHFAESRVQEAEGKFTQLRLENPELRLDLIGHLQRNKVKRAVALFDGIQSIDSLEILDSIAAGLRLPGEEARAHRIELLLELHTGEESKSGFPDADAVRRACEGALALRSVSAIELRGLMTMAPLGLGEAAIHSSFRTLKSLFDSLIVEFDMPSFTVLSMGMSGDFEIAVEEGATELRIGTTIFGERNP